MSTQKRTSPAEVFNRRTMSYVYENGWEFTNYFDGLTRISMVGERELRETVRISEPSPDMYLICWIDDDMGMLAQIVDLKNRSLEVAVNHEGNAEIWRAQITHFE